MQLSDSSVLARCCHGVASAGIAGQLVVAAPAGLEETAAAHVRAGLLEAEGRLRWSVVTGGADRIASVRAALDAVEPGTDVVLVHDAARCLTPPDVFHRVVDALARGAASVVPGLPVTDTIKRVALGADGAEAATTTVDRAPLRRIQTPQGFRRDELLAAHRGAAPDSPATDDAMLMEAAGHTTVVIPGSEAALKITTAADLLVAQSILAATG